MEHCAPAGTTFALFLGEMGRANGVEWMMSIVMTPSVDVFFATQPSSLKFIEDLFFKFYLFLYYLFLFGLLVLILMFSLLYGQ